jgi:hypothetical protein
MIETRCLFAPPEWVVYEGMMQSRPLGRLFHFLVQWRRTSPIDGHPSVGFFFTSKIRKPNNEKTRKSGAACPRA